MTSQRRVRPISAAMAALAAGTLAGCFTTTADFEADAEEYIRTAVAEALEVTFVAVDCTPPLDQEVGTRFACTATEADGGLWEFDNVIDAPNEFTVNIARRP